MIQGRISKFETLGMLDGPGVRTVVFMQGCLLRCAYCHNPALLSFEGGTPYTPQELFEKIMRYQSYYKQNGGVTVSGGEPLAQTDFLIEFFRICKQNSVSTCLDTSGIGFGDCEELLKYTDTVLLDIKHTSAQGFKELTLVDKDLTIPFHEALINSNADIWIRQVIIPDVNDNEEYLKTLLEEILKFKNIKKIEFLPFHTMAEQVYKDLNIEYRYKGKPAMDNARAMELQEKFLELYRPYNSNLINK